MSILVVGSVGLDTVETPSGRVEDALGGAATYFSAAASYFAPVRVVAVVGTDFDLGRLNFLRQRAVDLSGLIVEDGPTFRWGGRYSSDLNERETLFTHLNVFESFRPTIPEAYRASPFVFLANIDPDLQLEVLLQVSQPKLVAMDTMNFWIDGKLAALHKVLRRVDLLFVNDSEARQLAGDANLIRSARKIFDFGPRAVVIKKGEHGAMLVTRESVFWTPAYPLESICDPTGAGDTFAGGFMGYLARSADVSDATLRRAIVYGSTLASFCVERFSLDRLMELSLSDIEQRFADFAEMTRLP
jgi:sugar/nucleoside kinase (ribokinase family)